MELTLTWDLILLFCFVSMLAGTIDVLAGGGGLLVLPTLILSGIPPLTALGTNKLQSTVGTATSSFHMFRKRKVQWHHVRFWMLSAFIGSALGTISVQFVNQDILSFVVPVVLLVIALYFLLSPWVGRLISHRTISDAYYRNLVLPVVGYYDGMFGPGTGSFFAFAGVVCKGWDIVHATAVAKCLNFATNIAALVVFIAAGQVVWKVGLAMMLGQVVGASLGAHMLFRVNPTFVRVLVVLVCSAMLIRYLLEQ